MKFFSKILLSLALVFAFITTAKAEEEVTEEYHYGYILSCTTFYDTWPFELDEDMCVFYLELYEEFFCGDFWSQFD